MSALVQRWREKRTSYRPAGEVIDAKAFEVAALDEMSAKSFVVGHHYSGTYPAARFRFGLFGRGGVLAGTAVFSHPSNDKVLTNVFPGVARESVELGRFVLLDQVPGNGETWFLARAFALLKREGLRGVVSFADPMPRSAEDGTITSPGHVGVIYQAFNGAYLGRSTARTLHLLPNGTTFSARAQQKIGGQERGWRYAVEQLVAAGLPAPSGDLGAWLKRTVSGLRKVRHPGNHRYAWPLGRSKVELTRQPFPRLAAA